MSRVSGLRAVWAVLTLGVLAACGTPKSEILAPTAFRPAEAPIFSAAAFQPARIQGTWRQAAVYARAERSACHPGAIRVEGQGAQLQLTGKLCLDGREVNVSGPARMTGPGRIAVSGTADWWVIWVDYDYRTMAIATPSGDFGFVLDRGQISADRLRAAAEIFDFNGYAKTGLKRF